MKTLYTWTACAAFILAWGAASAYFDQQREAIEAQDALHATGQLVKYAAQMLRLNGAVMSSTALRIVATGHRVKL